MKPVVAVSQDALAARPADDAFGAEVEGRVSAFIELTKPRIVLMVLITVAVGFLAGARHDMAPSTFAVALKFAVTLLGAGLVAGGASTLNQYIERDRDARMRRTNRRPLPSGRLTPAEAAIFGTTLGVVGTLILLAGANALSAATAMTTLLLYVFVYTPLKPRSTVNTVVGAAPGALPPVIGWTAAAGTLGIEAWTLFLILFLWQFPHFLAIAWIYRDDYARGGMKMLPGVDPTGAATGRQAALYALALVPVGLLPATVGMAGPLYFVGAFVLGLAYLESSVRFWSNVDDATARRLVLASVAYLPAILLLLVLNPLPA